MRNRVLELRKKAGLTQEALADAVGVSRRTGVALDGPNYKPSVELALRIARALNTTVEEVYQLDDNRKPVDAAADQ